MEMVTDLTFSRTIERSLVHRWALSEVFITDYKRAGDAGFYVAAQLPLFHGYYTDFLTNRTYDPLLLLECSRQAALVGCFVHLDIPTERFLLAKEIEISVDRPEELVTGKRPGELLLEATVAKQVKRTSGTELLDFAFNLYLSGQLLGQSRIAGSSIPSKVYERIRGRRDEGRPTSVFDLPPSPEGSVVPPHLVGRWNPANVVLMDLSWRPDALSSHLGVTPGNRSLFDHDSDHVPGMTLLEGARQAGLLLLDGGTGWAARRMQLHSVRGTFRRFAEPDRGITLEARRSKADAWSEGFTSSDAAVVVEIVQEKEPVAEIAVAFTPVETCFRRLPGVPGKGEVIS